MKHVNLHPMHKAEQQNVANSVVGRSIELDARGGNVESLSADVSAAIAEYESVVIERRATKEELAA